MTVLPAHHRALAADSSHRLAINQRSRLPRCSAPLQAVASRSGKAGHYERPETNPKYSQRLREYQALGGGAGSLDLVRGVARRQLLMIRRSSSRNAAAVVRVVPADLFNRFLDASKDDGGVPLAKAGARRRGRRRAAAAAAQPSCARLPARPDDGFVDDARGEEVSNVEASAATPPATSSSMSGVELGGLIPDEKEPTRRTAAIAVR